MTPALAATQHRPRLLAPARQLVCRRDQRLLPRRVGTPIAPANHRSGTASGYNSTPEASASQVTSIRVAYGSAGHQLARSDHPGLYESAVGEVCCFKTCCSDHPGLSESAVGKVCKLKVQTRYPAIRVAYGTAGHQFACSDHPGLSESAAGKVCRLKVANQVSGHPRGILHRRTSACLQ